MNTTNILLFYYKRDLTYFMPNLIYLQKDYKRKTMARKKYPQSTQEAFEIIDKMLTDDEKREAIKLKTDDFTGIHHFDLGLWVRNNWIYKGDVSYCILTGEKEPEIKEGIPFPIVSSSPDDISGKFLELYHKHLKKTFKP